MVLRPWQRLVVSAMFPEDGSPSRWTTFLLSTIKKAGKTTLNAWVTLYAALTFPPGETVFVLANDQAQAEENCFDLIVDAVRTAGLEKSGEAIVRSDRIIFSKTGTRIITLSADFAGAAGARFGVTSWTELWAYRHESHVRLWEELTPIPNRRSLRIVDSYAGYENDAPALEPLWKRALEGERLDPELPVYSNGQLWAYIDQGVEAQERGWLGRPEDRDAYYAEQAASLRPGTFARLHLNQWQSGAEVFIDAETYDGCVRHDLRPVVSDPGVSVCVGVDAATRRDCAAVAAVARVTDDEGKVIFRLVRHRIWTVDRGGTLDLEATMEAFLLELSRGFRVVKVLYDPSQFVRSAQALEGQGLRMEKFDQTSGNLTVAGQNLFDLLKAEQLELYPDDELRRHFLNAVAVSSGRGWRLAKEKASAKIDGCAAVSFAALAAVQSAPVDLSDFVNHELGFWAAEPGPSRWDLDGPGNDFGGGYGGGW